MTAVNASRRGEERFQRMVEAQKMEAIGRLAGGVVHDFNNLLTVILAETELLYVDAAGMEGMRDGLDEIRRATQRAAGLTRRLLAFACTQRVEPTRFAINEVVTDTTRMLQRLLGEDVRLTTCLAPDAGSVRADRGQIEQVLTNLAINGRDAMPHGGSLLLETRHVTIAAADSRAGCDVKPGTYVRLSVRDTGSGMSTEVQQRLFEPFFTTKEPGHGTGLGLATSYGIVTHAGGYITVESAPGAGSTFHVFLPHAGSPD
jgi:two-component system cell cycle sensor histidine kinase/response regulator CckA